MALFVPAIGVNTQPGQSRQQHKRCVCVTLLGHLRLAADARGDVVVAHLLEQLQQRRVVRRRQRVLNQDVLRTGTQRR